MTLAFWDSSALVKLLVEEAGTDLAAALWDGSSSIVASQLVVPEVAAALATARRTGRLDGRRAGIARSQWGQFRAALDLVDVTPEVADGAAQLAGAHPLSGADAVHLATALLLREVDLLVATWDQRLATAAVAEGLAVVPQPT